MSRMPTSLGVGSLICAGLPEPQSDKLGLRQFFFRPHLTTLLAIVAVIGTPWPPASHNNPLMHANENFSCPCPTNRIL